MVDRTKTSMLAWTGATFAAQVRRTGKIGFVERGRPRDVPSYLARLATGMWGTDNTRSSFYWKPPGEAMICQVTMEMHREGSFEYVLLTGEPVSELPHSLSLRELEVLALLMTGLGNAKLAAELWITERTAASHINHVLQKLGLETRTAAATYALDTGLIHLPLPGGAEHYSKLAIGRLVSAADTNGSAPASRDLQSRTRRLPYRPRELVVGAVVPRTGLGKDDGKEMLNGLHLAIEEINAAGGIRGRTIAPLLVDVDVTSSASVKKAFTSLLGGGADVLTSGYLAAQDVAHEIAGDSGIPYLHAATSGVMERAVRSDIGRFGNVFQMCASDTTYAPTFVSYMLSLHDRGLWRSDSRRLVVLLKNWTHVDFGVTQAMALAEQAGWQLECVPVRGTGNGDDWMRAATSALREPAAAMMIGSYFVDDVAQAIIALKNSNARTLAYAIYAPSVPAFRERLGDAADGVLWATMTGTYSDRHGVAFGQRYARRFGMQPGRSHAGLAYDRMHRIALAWQMSNDLADMNEVAGHLRSHPYRGVNGTYNFDTPGQAAQGFEGPAGDPSLAQPQLVFQIQDGQQVIVDGGPFATGDFRLPAHLMHPSDR